ncbi:MAG: alpha/beta fold hydrolase [Solirubrobacterales bacterium]|nr:alpha/beta fold hydrolase [Solirubrobacterales bacterium]
MAYRTPDDRFTDLPDFPYEPHYLEHDGLRIAYLDEGPKDGPAVWLMHGEPTWSFLYRKVMGPLLEAGFRCLVPDLVGFGRSDKPEAIEDYTYEKHVGWMSAVVDHLAPTDCTMVVHDWGGPIGMRLFVEHPDAFSRIAIMDTGFFTGEQRMSDAWKAFRDFTERTEDLPIGFLVNGGAKSELPPEVIAAYDAPFPEPAAKAGARAFPLMIPTSPDAVGADAGRALRDAMIADDRAKLQLWADGDPIIPMAAGEKIAELLGAPIEPVADASHFLQEDAGAAIGARLVSWLS